MNNILKIVSVGPMLLLAGYAIGAAADSLPAGVSKLDATGVQKYIAGNTVTGTSQGKPYEEYYPADGTIHGLWNYGTRYSGSWTVRSSDGWLCFKYKDPSSNGCWFAAVMQNAGQFPSQVYWLNSDGSVDGNPTGLKQGNPDGL